MTGSSSSLLWGNQILDFGPFNKAEAWEQGDLPSPSTQNYGISWDLGLSGAKPGKSQTNQDGWSLSLGQPPLRAGLPICPAQMPLWAAGCLL